MRDPDRARIQPASHPDLAPRRTRTWPVPGPADGGEPNREALDTKQANTGRRKGTMGRRTT